MDATKHGRTDRVKRLPGRWTPKRKPLKERLAAHDVRYEDVARLADRSYRAVQKHIDGQTHSPAIQAAIEKLTGTAA